MLPNFLLIGAMKSGTSSLYHHLKNHPQIYMAKGSDTRKTIHFFSKDDVWDKGLGWYESFFPNSNPRKYRLFGERKYLAIGEASGTYSKYPRFDQAAERIYQTIPHAKLIYIVRDPIKRLLSHLDHRVIENASSQAITLENFDIGKIENVLNTSRYYTQLERYLKFFPKEQIHVLSMEDLRDDPRATLQDTFRFLEVDDGYWSPSFEKASHNSSAKFKRKQDKHDEQNNVNDQKAKPLLIRNPDDLPPEVLNVLQDALREEVEKLRNHTGKSFSQWSL